MRNPGDGSGNLPAMSLPARQFVTDALAPAPAGDTPGPAATHAASASTRATSDAPSAAEHLLCELGDLRCAMALRDLREALPTLPAAVTLPFSPPWLLGMFPWRTELAGLIDPMPLLLGATTTRSSVPADSAADPAAPSAMSALPPTSITLAAVLVAGEDDRLLGLGVTRLGGVAVIGLDALTRRPAAEDPLSACPFVRGWYTAAADGSRYAVLDLPALLAACLTALQDEAHDV